MQVISWNVNGLRSCLKKGFLEYLHGLDDVILGLQEVRSPTEGLSDAARFPKGFYTHFNPGEKAGYSGTGLYSRWVADEVECSIKEERFDVEGRVQMARFGQLWVVNVYFPNGGRDLSRVDYKLDFYEQLRELLKPRMQNGEHILVMGDYNTAHREIDLARPKPNVKKTGFLPKERDFFQYWIDDGWVDTFRHLNPTKAEAYSWWSNMGDARQRNVGWRIDYVLASPGLMPFLKDAQIHTEIMGSDHCPVSVTLDDKAFGTQPALASDYTPVRSQESLI